MSSPGMLCLGIVSLAAFGALREDRLLEDGVDLFEQGYKDWNIDRFREAADRFAEGCAARPDSYEGQYWLGATRFHVLLHRLGDDRNPPDNKEKRRLLEEAVAPLERAVRLKPDDSEAHAVLATLLGMQIAADPPSALWLGRKVLDHRRVALENGPGNPRAQYLLGTAYFHMPALLGRKDKGLAFFLAAEKLYEKEATAERPPLSPRWGYGTCLTFIGRIYRETGKDDEARTHFERALAVNPQDKLARKCLGEMEKPHGKR